MDHYCYLKIFKLSNVVLLLYVDDMLVVGSCLQEINKLKQPLEKEFATKDLGAEKQILRMRFSRDKAQGTLKLNPAGYIERVLARMPRQLARH